MAETQPEAELKQNLKTIPVNYAKINNDIYKHTRYSIMIKDAIIGDNFSKTDIKTII